MLGGEERFLTIETPEVDGHIPRWQPLSDGSGNRRQHDVWVETALEPVSQAGKRGRSLWAGVVDHGQLGLPANPRLGSKSSKE